MCHACKNYFGVGMFSPEEIRRYKERQMRGPWEVSLFILHGFGEVLLLMLYGFAKVAQGSHAKANCPNDANVWKFHKATNIQEAQSVLPDVHVILSPASCLPEPYWDGMVSTKPCKLCCVRIETNTL